VNVSSLPPESEGQPSRSAPRAEGSRGRETEAARLVGKEAAADGRDRAAEACDLTSQRVWNHPQVLRRRTAAQVMQAQSKWRGFRPRAASLPG
jgi:hypothetical protein